MTVIDDAALGFFADYLAAGGGLFESRDGVVTCLVPEPLGRTLDLPEAITVTADPDASREDGALLLAPGHPLIDTAADAVLAAFDVGVRHVRATASRPASLQELLPRVRDQVVVDHGRIDAANDAPAAVRVPVVRAGALVTYDVTPEDRFQEQAEVWIDAATGLEFPAGISLSADDFCEGPTPDDARPLMAHDLPGAVGAAHRVLEGMSSKRLAELGRQCGARAAREGETARAQAYYDAALGSLDHRRASAAPERQTLLDAQAESVRAERDRRLSEIAEKFESRFQLRPFRLQLVTLPALALPLVARRGARTWPLTAIWLVGHGRTLPLTCPKCGTGASLVAGKAHLGCRSCLPRASLAPVAPVHSPVPAQADGPRRRPGPRPGPAPDPVVPAGRRRRPATVGTGPAPHRDHAADVVRAGDRLAKDLWRTILSGRRLPRRDLARGSPLEALVRASGHRSILVALDLPAGLALEELRVVTLPSRRHRAEVTTGALTVLGMRIPFTLRWRREGARGLPGELLPCVVHGPLLAAAPTLAPSPWFRVGPPPPHLDAVARAFWKLAAGAGAAVIARGLALWWSCQAALEPLSLTDDEAARLIADAVRNWPAGNLLVEHLGGPDWWVR
ncbi:MAG: hypothetical protein ACRD0S_00195 [Acidimicrobiales bacterium]